MELGILIPLKDEHIPDTFARLKLLEFYKSRADEAETAANRAAYVEKALQEAFNTAVAQGLGREQPQELANIVLLIEEHRAESLEALKLRGKFLRTYEALQDALALWFASLYGFDAVKDKYELDLDNRVLRRVATSEHAAVASEEHIQGSEDVT